MYRWYSESTVCYAYLVDVPHNDLIEESLRRSRWFTRGWTRQELIAPSRLYFYSQEWIFIDRRNSIGKLINDITKIPISLLGDQYLPTRQEFSVAQKMSSASRRSTTQPEDTAYSLMGVFGINMPLLYGEGAKAFIRLQETIIQQCESR